MITLSIVSHRQAILLATLLDDLARLDPPAVTSIVITHNVPEAIPEWPAVLTSRITTMTNAAPRGFGANHNAAFRRCNTPFFAVLNPDLRFVDDPFEDLTAAFASVALGLPRGQGVGMTAPVVVTTDGIPEDSLRSLMTPWAVLRRRLDRANRMPAVRPHWLAGMFLMLSSAVFRKVGGFDERFFMYCEDFDLCARLRLDGWSFRVVESAVVMHAAQRASHRSYRHLLWHVSSLVKMWTSSTFWRYRRLLASDRAERDDAVPRQVAR